MPSHFPLQHIGVEFHSAEGELCLAQVLQRGTYMIGSVIYAEEAVAQDYVYFPLLLLIK